MNSVNSHQEALKRRWDEMGTSLYNLSPPPFCTRLAATCGGAASSSSTVSLPPTAHPRNLLGLSTSADAATGSPSSAVVPPVTVVLEGRSICHRVHLHRHAGYASLAAALRRLFVDTDGDRDEAAAGENGLDLSNAVPGHMVAYEDMEDDLLLAGDLSWKDFVRVAKRIRIIPAKASRRKRGRGT